MAVNLQGRDFITTAYLPKLRQKMRLVDQPLKGATVADTAQVLSRYLDGVMIRTYAHKDVEELVEFATILVINGLAAWQHPRQAMGDLMTIRGNPVAALASSLRRPRPAHQGG